MLSLLPFSGKPGKSELTAQKKLQIRSKIGYLSQFGAYLFIIGDY